jgi:hypothetical protein
VHSQYYGSGESFLFKCTNGVDTKKGSSKKDGSSGLDVYRWTEKNEYFMLARCST